MTTATKTDRQSQIDELFGRIQRLRNEWVLVGHNDGTYGGAECHRYTGTGRTKAGLCEVYEQVGSCKRRYTRDPDNSPGYMRYGSSKMDELRALLRELESQYAALRFSR